MVFLWMFEFIVLLIGILAGYLTSFLGFIVYTICYIIVVNMLIYNIIVTIINREKKKIRNKNLIMLVILIVWLVFSYKLYNLIDDYNEVSKGLKEEFNNYKIVGLSNEKLVYGEEIQDCGFVFDISLGDNTNIIFQAGYCVEGGTFRAYNEVINNYINYYLPYYYNIYKLDNRATFKIEMSGDRLDKIIYNKNNKEELINFLEYLVEKNDGISYHLILVDEDSNKINIFYSNEKLNDI